MAKKIIIIEADDIKIEMERYMQDFDDPEEFISFKLDDGYTYRLKISEAKEFAKEILNLAE